MDSREVEIILEDILKTTGKGMGMVGKGFLIFFFFPLVVAIYIAKYVLKTILNFGE